MFNHYAANYRLTRKEFFAVNWSEELGFTRIWSDLPFLSEHHALGAPAAIS